MNTKPYTITLAVIAALALTGCGHKEGDGHNHAQSDAAHDPAETHSETTAGIIFREKSGLQVSPATAAFIGLETAEVEERKVAAEFRFTAQVYRAAGETRFASTQPVAPVLTRASGRVGPVEAARLQEGQPLPVTVSGAPEPLSASVTALDRTLEAGGGQVEVLLAVADPQGRLAKGDFVTVTVPLGGEQAVVSVPRTALLRTLEGDFVYAVSGDFFVRARVSLGAVNEEFAEVTDGLYAGDKIVVRPAMTLWLAEIQGLRGGKSCAHGH